MRVLLVCEYGSLNGGEHSMLAILPTLQSAGVSFAALAPAPSDLASSLDSMGIEVRPLMRPVGEHSQRELRSQIDAGIKAVKPDIVHANSLSTSRLCGPVASSLRTGCVGHVRDILRVSRRAMDDINELDVVIAVSNATAKYHISQGLNPSKTHVVYNGINLERFAPARDFDRTRAGTAPLRQELQIEEDTPLILAVGQIGMRKGLDVMMDTFAEVRRELSAAHLAFIGERHSQKQEAIEYERQVRGKADQCGHVHWLGRRIDVASWMRTATMLLHTAKQEPLGRVLLEASASGLPIVATDVGGTSEILAPELAMTWLAPQDRSDLLAARTVELLRSKALRESVGDQLRADAVAQFSSRRCAEETGEIYRQLASSDTSFSKGY